MTLHLDQGLVSRFDALEGKAREDVLRHAARCSRCREALIAEDQARLFGMLALESPSDEALERVSENVMRQVGEPRVLRQLASVAASLLLAGIFGVYMMGNRGSGPTASLETALEAPVVSDSIELIASPGEAQVMEFTVGETQIVMIFDEAMDI
jgi:anti-sigma factor RsiW